MCGVRTERPYPPSSMKVNSNFSLSRSSRFASDTGPCPHLASFIAAGHPACENYTPDVSIYGTNSDRADRAADPCHLVGYFAQTVDVVPAIQPIAVDELAFRRTDRRWQTSRSVLRKVLGPHNDDARHYGVYDLQRDTSTKLTFTGSSNRSPLWMPDGKHIVLTQGLVNGESVIWWIRADGSGQPEKPFGANDAALATSLSPDGRRVLFEQRGTPMVSTCGPCRWTSAIRTIRNPANRKCFCPRWATRAMALSRPMAVGRLHRGSLHAGAGIRPAVSGRPVRRQVAGLVAGGEVPRLVAQRA